MSPRRSNIFDFDRLPDHLIVEILRYLDFAQRFVVARVNRRFHRLSELTISTTDRLRFGAEWHSKLTPDEFRSIVEMFVGDLRSITVERLWTPDVVGRLDAIADFAFPRLVSFESYGWTDRMATLLGRCSNLRRLNLWCAGSRSCQSIDRSEQLRFPNVEVLGLSTDSVDFFEFILDACPNVKEIRIKYLNPEIVARTNRLFAERGQSLESILIDDRPFISTPGVSMGASFGDFPTIWSLRALRSLTVCFESIKPHELDAISRWLPRLRVLRLWSKNNVDEFVSRLSTMSDLIDLDLAPYGCSSTIRGGRQRVSHDVNGHDGIREFATTSRARQLERFTTAGTVRLATIRLMIDRFPRLIQFGMDRLSTDDSELDTTRFLRSIRHGFFERRRLVIKIGVTPRSIRESREVRKAMKQVRRMAAGERDGRRRFVLRMIKDPSEIVESRRWSRGFVAKWRRDIASWFEVVRR